MQALVVFLLLGSLAGVYWAVALVAPRRRDGVPGVNLPEVAATEETWRAAHRAISTPMIIIASVASVTAMVIPGAMLAGVDVRGWWVLCAIAVGVVGFSALVPRALRAARTAGDRPTPGAQRKGTE